MPATLKSGRSNFLRPWHFQTAKGEWFSMNGLNRMQRWNGRSSASQDAGITAPTTAATIGSSDVGSISGTYTAYVRYVDDEGIPSALSPISNSVAVVNVRDIDYTSVPVSPESRVTKREIYRNTTGQATTYYLDATINDNVTTSVTSTKTDSQLTASTALPLRNSDGSPNADRFGVPVSTKRVAQELHERFIYGVSAIYDEGSVHLTNSSTTVAGYGNAFTADMDGRYLYIPGHATRYLIDSVDTSANTLTLSTAYTGSTDLFSLYAIQEHEDDRNKWYFTTAGEPESSYATDNFKVEHYDGDVDTSAWRLGQSLFVVQRGNIWQVAFSDDPLCDMTIRHIAFRGVVNPFCWVQVEGTIFALDYRGAYVFDGGGVKHISEPIQDIWRRDTRPGTHDYRLNWQNSERWHATHSPSEQVIRFHVHLGGGHWPRESLAYNYRNGQWWIEEYAWGIAGSSTAQIAGIVSPIMGWRNEILTPHGTCDRTFDDGGLLRGYVDSSTPTSITDSGAQHPASFVVGSTVTIVNGTGKGQQRIIDSSSSGTLTITNPWIITPDTTSEYVIGGVEWRRKSKSYRLFQRERDETRRIKVVAEPTALRTTMDMRLFYDREKSARQNVVGYTRSGATAYREDTDIVWDMQLNPVDDDPNLGNWLGFRDWNVDYRLEPDTMGDRWMAVEIAGVQCGSRVSVYEIDVEGGR